MKAVLAGAIGTAAMTAHQTIRQRLARDDSAPNGNDQPDFDEAADPWESAPAPAQVGKRLICAVTGAPPSPDAIPVLAQVMHWSYGSSWGAGYAVARRISGLPPGLLGPAFGVFVWAMSYVQLVPLGIYEPPWTYPLSSLADELAYHITYGTGVAISHQVLDD
jgi:hypothetical protein